MHVSVAEDEVEPAHARLCNVPMRIFEIFVAAGHCTPRCHCSVPWYYCWSKKLSSSIARFEKSSARKVCRAKNHLLPSWHGGLVRLPRYVQNSEKYCTACNAGSKSNFSVPENSHAAKPRRNGRSTNAQTETEAGADAIT